MKIVAISDTHCSHEALTIPPCDVLIHAGDSTWQGRFFEVRDFLYWMERQPATHKIVIAGNHELTLDQSHVKYNPTIREMLLGTCKDSIHYLENASVVIDGVKFYGTPWTPWFHSWAFNGIDDGVPPYTNNPYLRDIFGKVDDDTNVLICHGPCYGLVDEGGHGNADERLGSVALLRKSQSLKQVRLIVGGHIHEARGVKMSEDKMYANVASLDRDYKTIRPPMIFNLDENGKVTYEQ